MHIYTYVYIYRYTYTYTYVFKEPQDNQDPFRFAMLLTRYLESP